jgi:hypothetical protein
MEIDPSRIMSREEGRALMLELLSLLSPSAAEQGAEPLQQPDVTPRPATLDAVNDDTLSYWSKRKERALAERHELELARRRGEVVDIDETRRQLETCFGIIRERLLTIPGKLADALAGRTRDEVFAILADEIDATLTELSAPADVAARVLEQQRDEQ